MKAPPGIAKFDSATVMAKALGRYLAGKNFANLGQSRLQELLVRNADLVPRHLCERIFAHAGALEGIKPADIDQVSMSGIARWVTELYPHRRYPAMMIGSSNGALVHLGAALGIPWLPQTLLTLVKQRHVHPDEPVQAMQTEMETARRFLQANPDSQLHHMHDPSQDRLMLGLITYYRSKFLRLPSAYREFIADTLEPGGTLYIVECDRRWKTTRLGERYVFQFGAEGGPTMDEYLHGGERVAAYLARYGSAHRRWHPPATDTDSPEAEWGFEPALREELVELARRQGYRVVRILFEDPEEPSPVIANLYRSWYAQRGLPVDRLAVESFVLHEPYMALRTGSVPYWMTFNMQPSLDNLNRYLDQADPFNEIYMMLFAHGVDSVGLPPIEAWQAALARAGNRGELLGLKPHTYPAHFAHFARYSQELGKRVGERYPLPESMPLAQAEEYIRAEGPRHGVRLEVL